MSEKKPNPQLELENDVRSVMSTVQGRRFVWYLLGIAHTFESTFAANALTMSFLSGQRDFGLRLLALIMEVDQESYLLMQREAIIQGESE